MLDHYQPHQLRLRFSSRHVRYAAVNDTTIGSLAIAYTRPSIRRGWYRACSCYRSKHAGSRSIFTGSGETPID